jgi:replication-associated recombination protein RarA
MENKSKDQNWVEKYRPNYFAEIKSQEIAVKKVKDFIESFLNKEQVESKYLAPLLKKDIPKKALILHGPPGTGKTALAHVAAKETVSEIFELNASDLRNKEKLKEILKPAI